MPAGKPAKEKAPSNVELTTFAIYKVDGKGSRATVKALYGAADARLAEDGRVELLAGNAPFHSDVFKSRAPKAGHGLLMLYGVRDSLEQLQFWSAKARELNAQFAYAQVKVEVGYIEVGLTNRSLFQRYGIVEGDRKYPSRFLNVRRMASDLQTEILKHFQLYSDRERGTKNTDMASVAQIATRPDYFDYLFQESKDFHKNLDLLVIPVADDPEEPARIRQLAYLRPGAKIVEVTQGTDEAFIVLPRWMTDEKFARKVREEPAGL